jgi:hypothetical protein
MQTQDLFPLGRLVATPRAMEAIGRSGDSVETLLARHATRDWGDVSTEDKQENDRSIAHGFRLLSAYTLKDGRKVWIITEVDRSATTVLLPEEY